MQAHEQFDVVIIGAGLAGLSLARHLQLASGSLRICQIDKRTDIPPTGQKVGEATVQVSGYYLSKVLELEEYLLREHYLKYNLRFYWKSPGRDNSRFEDYSQGYVREISNVPSYQLNRNTLEGELLRRNRAAAQYVLVSGVQGVEVDLATEGPHRVTITTRDGRRRLAARWVVDASGRAQVLARKRGLTRQNPIRHGASFLWVEGLVNIEWLTDATPRQIRLNPARSSTGHLPFWLATNHFCGEGFWFWTIPLQGVTSLGLVYDNRRVSPAEVNAPDKLVAWVCREFPLFARDLPQRSVLHHASYRDFSFDCQQTIDAARWALVGEAGRFTDPLYSPGGDLIAIYNTLIADAILTDDADELRAKVPLYEQLMRAVYGAYVPSYAISYDALGDQESFRLKYAWELTIYFAFYVFPFINDLFTDRRFVVSFLQAFSRLGRVNASLQGLINAFYHWKVQAGGPKPDPELHDFREFGALVTAERTFYEVGVSVERARAILETQLANALALARLIAALVHAAVLDDDTLVRNRSFVESLDLERLTFDPDAMRQAAAAHAASRARYEWPWSIDALAGFGRPHRGAPAPASAIATAD